MVSTHLPVWDRVGTEGDLRVHTSRVVMWFGVLGEQSASPLGNTRELRPKVIHRYHRV